MVKRKTQGDLFKFFEDEDVVYVVTRGADEESIGLRKDLDILISKKDYERVKRKVPRINRDVDFYVDCERHYGVVFITRKALVRRVFDNGRGFFVLGDKDFRRMIFFRKILKIVRKIKKFLGMYGDGKD